MNWSALTPEAFRRELTGILESMARPPRATDKAGRLARAKYWSAALYDREAAGPAWPRAYGGMDLPFALQVAYHEVLGQSHIPQPPGSGVGLAGPTIYKHGTPEQRERYLRPMLRGDEIWAQGFSEPEAGSDLASLRTTARREGDRYIVNGQKVWNSYADQADMFFALVRTGQAGSKGITYLLIEAASPGVTVRPLRDMTGHEVFCEIFFDDVVVPVSNRVGEENGGWSIARTTLGHERAAGALQQAAFYQQLLKDVVALASTSGRDTGLTRLRLAQFWADAHVMRVMAMRTIADIAERGEPGATSSVSRLISTKFEQDLHEFALDLLGPDGLASAGAADSAQPGRWLYGFLRTRASTIGAGTAEIQRNIIAERILQMPRISG